MATDAFDELALNELKRLIAGLDELGEDLDPELASDVLTIEFPDGERFVVNSHRAAQQIWLAADKRAWHFSCDSTTESWVAHKTGDELWHVLRELLSAKLGRSVTLVRR